MSESPTTTTNIVILAAGQGTRMKSRLPKVLHRIAGRSMVRLVLDAAAPLAPERTIVVLAPGMDRVAAEVAPAAVAVQEPALGTAHAVMAARDALAGARGGTLVLFGDTPLVKAETLGRLRAALCGPGRPAIVVLGFRPADPAAYGRLVLDGDGGLARIVEFKDASAEERAIGLCNAGAMAFDSELLPTLLDGIGNDNAKGEYYLTDAVAIARRLGRAVAVIEADADEVLGVNSRAELAVAESVLQRRLRLAAMENGATLVDPDTVHFSWDTRLGRDVLVGPNVVFGPGVEIADDVEIKAFCHIEGARVAPGAVIGPFARLRPGAEIGSEAHIGNFVEIKKAAVGEGAKINHLSYVGDAEVGAKSNIGAGTITCNYDGFDKHVTRIGEGAFIGSNTALVAPVSVGPGAIVGAGSVVAKDVAGDALAVTRGPHVEKPGWAARFRAAKARARKAKE
jgi:bifunctional UDP-N-acetylglucosamine pyrophosphorylase/glucosamine-1-phosphate N-acetyltransferase